MTVDIAPRMYCSLVDDFAVNKGISGSISTIRALNRHLVSAVLFGDTVLVNDGHVLLNPALQAAVLDSKVSPFRRLVEKGFVQLISRSGRDLGELGQTMADRNIVSAQNLTRTDRYRAVLKPALDSWTRLLGADGRSFVDWPTTDTQFIYQDLAKRVFAELMSRGSRYESQFERFGQELGWTNTTFRSLRSEQAIGSKRVLDIGVASRTGWEETAKQMTARNELSADAARVLMQAGHEAYNYLWGSTLTTPTTPIRIQGPIPRLLGDLDVTEGTLAIHPRGPVTLLAPDEDFALRSMHSQWDKLDPFSDPRHELVVLKRRFNETLVDYYTGSLVSEDQMQRAAKDYGEALSRHFGAADKVAGALVVVFAAAGIAGTVLTAGTAAIAIGIGTVVGGSAAPTKLVQQKLLWRLSSPDHKGWITKRSGPRTTSWFPFDPAVAQQMTRGVPEFGD